MPHFRTRLINTDFDSTDDGLFHESVEDASRAGILSAIDVSKGLFAAGESCPHLEVVILDGENAVARHRVRVDVTDVAI